MPARRGNGPGHGGPAKGTSSRPAFTRDNQPTPERKSAGWDVAAEIRDQIAARRSAILEAQFQRALDVAHPQGNAAAVDLLNRVMPPESKVRVSTSDPDQMTDDELAAIVARASVRAAT